ncbi:MAG: PHP domain-containing protein [Actinomycetota bacterium]
MLDYHLHLWEHGRQPANVTAERLAAYWERAQQAGVTEIAVTEHSSRFVEISDAVGRFWEDDPDSPAAFHDPFARAWDEEGKISLDTYVEAALEAKRAGVPIVLGLEVDLFEGKMDRVASVLDHYPFDVLLGSVHWLGAWCYDDPDLSPAYEREWNVRGIERAWDEYSRGIEEIAASGAIDVLAHADYIKTSGHPRPAIPDEFYDRIAEAAASSGIATEVSSSAYEYVDEPYPAPPLLARFRDRGVPVTTASDAHDLPDVAHRADDLRKVLDDAGYTELVGFRERRPHPHPISR